MGIVIFALFLVIVFIVATGKFNGEISSGSMDKKKPCSRDSIFGISKSKEKPKDMLDDWSYRCSECGEYFEDCECNCDDDDCHNEGGW